MLQQLNGLWSGSAFLWGLKRGELCPGADVSFYILGYLIWSLRQRDRRERGGQVVTPQCCTTPSSPTSGVEQSRAESRGIAQRCLQDAVGSFPTTANRCFQPGLCRGSFAEQEAPCCSSREAKVLCRNPWDTAQCWSEREQANFLGNPQMKTCPFSTEQLRNFGCPPRV